MTDSTTAILSTTVPAVGEIVGVRSRQYLVEGIVPGGVNDCDVVRLACIDDDAQGETLEVLWQIETDATVRQASGWERLRGRGFDAPRLFSSWLHTLRWNCVTATDPKLFQAPFRAGIRIDAYQIEPLRKALLLPRVNLFIADDVGLGKTIEAGLIARELLLRKKVRDIVVACPPSVLPQWRDELEQRFGLGFEILDREYVSRIRRERGYATNPWRTHSRFLISHRLLIDENYTEPLRDWLGAFRPGSLLILDEAHHAAPASSGKYAIDSKITRAIRDIAPRFEHRLFLSATPHNGHSNSFSALLEILDPQRFCRGVPIRGNRLLDDVMVRRLKEDIRAVQGGFPKREVVQIDIDGLPEDAPELALAALLDRYDRVREAQLVEEPSKRKRATARLLIIGLQQRLLSSVRAFARTLAVHRRTLASRSTLKTGGDEKLLFDLVGGSVASDDERADLNADELSTQEDEQFEAATREAFSSPTANSAAESLLAQMTEIASRARSLPDARVVKLLDWMREHQCPGIGKAGMGSPKWTRTRVLIFTEYEDTLSYLREQLDTALIDTDMAEERVGVYRGATPTPEREEIRRAFNTDPDRHPLRILLCTDAAREGINLQSHCADLFHFDVPWNPSRMEQRNGRIDRKLQPSEEVRCHYFVYRQRPEDRILQALVRKTETIRKELGSLSKVLEGRLSDRLGAGGIRRSEIARLEAEIGSTGPDAEFQETVEAELEEVRDRHAKLGGQIDQLQDRLNDSRKWVGLEQAQFRDALGSALEIVGAGGMMAVGPEGPFAFPEIDKQNGGDPSWADTLDSLRTPRTRDQKFWEWRSQSKIRPVVFDDPGTMTQDVVHLHLEHPVVRRLLGRFTAQGFVHNDLSRACFAQTTDAVPRVVLLGRLCLYGAGAARLHEELIAVAARWVDPIRRTSPLKPYAEDAQDKTLGLLEAALSRGIQPNNPTILGKLQESSERDVAELLEHLQSRGEELADRAEVLLTARGLDESKKMVEILTAQKKRIEATANRVASVEATLFNKEEMQQLESDRTHWGTRLAELVRELEIEPQRIRDVYDVKATRVEPVGLAYLWPITG